jgi:hypothetical protein
MHNQPSDSKGGNELLDELLKVERRAVLDLAENRRDSAARLDGNTARVAQELYLVADDHDIPLLSQKIRITKQDEGKVTEEILLYLPYDFNALIFITQTIEGYEPKKYVISENKTSTFEADEEMQIEMGHFLVPDNEFDADMLFPDAQEIEGEEEYKLLAMLKSALADTENYRFAAQNRPNAA